MLTGDELVEEALGVLVLEDGDGHAQLVVQVVVDLLHHHQRDVFMGDAMDEGVLQDVGERAVTNVVHQDGGLYGFCLAIEDELSLLLEREDGLAHQVEGS